MKKKHKNHQGNILLPVMLMVSLGVVISSINKLVSQAILKRIDTRIAELVAFPPAEVAAWKSYYQTGTPTGAVDAQGQYPVELELNYSSNLPASLTSSIPANSIPGTPFNLAQTKQFDSAYNIYSRVLEENLRYRPTQTVGALQQSCGSLKTSGKETRFHACLSKAGSPSVCPVGVCTPAIQTCIQNTELKTPILIHNQTELLAMSSGNYYQLANDIAMTKTNQVTALSLNGLIIDGQNFKISNLASRNNTQKLLGLFRDLNCSLIKNIILEGDNISTTLQTGGFLAQTILTTALANVRLNAGQFKLKQNPNLPSPGGLVGEATDSIFFKVSVAISITDGGTAVAGDEYNIPGPGYRRVGTFLGGIVGKLKGALNQMSEVSFGGSINVGEGCVGGIAGSSEDSEIRKATVNASLSSTRWGSVGGIVCSMGGGAIREAVYSGTILAGGSMSSPPTNAYELSLAGGIVAETGMVGDSNYHGQLSVIEKCISSGSVTADQNVGGLIGYMGYRYGVQIRQCRSSASINLSAILGSGYSYSRGRAIGGAVGNAECGSGFGGCLLEDVITSSALNRANATLATYPGGNGGVLGVLDPNLSNHSVISFKNCLIAGGVPALTDIYGVSLSHADIGTIHTNVLNIAPSITTNGSFFNTQTTGQATVLGSFVGKTTAELQTQSTFSGWDFANKWSMPLGAYPKLSWEP